MHGKVFPVNSELVELVTPGEWQAYQLPEAVVPPPLLRVGRCEYVCSLASGSQVHMARYDWRHLGFQIPVGLTRVREDPADRPLGTPYNVDNFLVAVNTTWKRRYPDAEYVCFAVPPDPKTHRRETVDDLLAVPPLNLPALSR